MNMRTRASLFFGYPQLSRFEKYEKAKTRIYIDIFRVFLFRLILIMALIVSLIRKVDLVRVCSHHLVHPQSRTGKRAHHVYGLLRAYLVSDITC